MQVLPSLMICLNCLILPVSSSKQKPDALNCSLRLWSSVFIHKRANLFRLILKGQEVRTWREKLATSCLVFPFHIAINIFWSPPFQNGRHLIFVNVERRMLDPYYWLGFTSLWLVWNLNPSETYKQVFAQSLLLQLLNRFCSKHLNLLTRNDFLRLKWERGG